MARFRLYLNPRADRRIIHRELTIARGEQAQAEITQCPRYAPTPLLRMQDFAARAGVEHVYYKHEADRFGLGSFKALGGAYAVSVLLREKIAAATGATPSLAELARGAHAHLKRHITVACASDGNHGRSVAAGAQMFGCRCIIFLHAGVSRGREDAIRSYGAETVRVSGDYDDSVRAAARAVESNGWQLVADTASTPEEERVAALVMQGYYVMTMEVLEHLGAAKLPLPTHVFLQGGVGGLAAAVAAHFIEALGSRAPKVIVVEPERADCLYQSALAGRPTRASGDLETVMAGLACGEVSSLAWRILDTGADAFMTIPDDAATDAMRELAVRAQPVVAGESATAGLAALLALASDRRALHSLGLDARARVLAIGTEGATDPALYRAIVGRTPEEVAQRAADLAVSAL